MEAINKAAFAIVAEQYRIIGPLAVDQANLVTGVSIDWDKRTATLTGDAKNVLGQLVEQYRAFFGQTSVEVCKDAAASTLHDLPKDQIPSILQ